ncbi:Hypothetical protein BN2458_PEG1902 [Helicobacter typhlonius]|uniref:Uncharacterized protein n=1 Tax=Helicobacter typhlonius TaxID=76936 RepID=A0A0S4PXL8_9HELI|nr:Hypothetical protein BN2458_PEG1902 [Helicobacter typhlonius]
MILVYMSLRHEFKSLSVVSNEMMQNGAKILKTLESYNP